MGASQGGVGDGPVTDQQSGDDEGAGKNKLLKVGMKAIAGGLQGLSQQQQPQQVPGGPQLGAGVTQAPQAQDPYQAYLLKLQQQNQTPFYGN